MRKLSFLMAFIMFMGSLIVPSFTSEIFAANDINYEVNFLNKMIAGEPPTIVPANSSDSEKTGNAFFEWDINTSSKYVLKYPLEDGKIAELTLDAGTRTVDFVIKNGSGAVIDTALYNSYQYYKGSVYLPTNGNEIKYTGTLPTDRIVFYSDSGNTIKQPTPQFVVNSTNRPMGYSFKYADREMHFLFNGNKFSFSTNGFLKGLIYPAVLTKDTVAVDTYNIFTGLDKDKFTSTPTVNYPSRNNVPTPTNVYPQAEYGLSNILDRTGTPPINPLPAEYYNTNEKNNRIELSIPKPKIWDDVTSKFKTASSEINIDLNIEMTPKTLNSPALNIVLNNFTNTPTATLLGGTTTLKIIGTPDATGDSVKIKIGELDNGIIFDTFGTITKLTKGTEKFVYNTKVNLPFGAVYTFLRYQFAVKNNRYNILVNLPYQNVSGRYVFYWKNSQESDIFAEVFVDANQSTKEILASIPIDFGTFSENTYFIKFIPEALGDKVAIITQTVKERTSPADQGIGMSTKFWVDDNPILVPNQQDTTKANLTFNMGWDIADIKTINYLLDQTKDDTLYVDYNIYKKLNPNINSAQLMDNIFYRVRVKIVRSGTDVGKRTYTLSYEDIAPPPANTPTGILDTTYKNIDNNTYSEEKIGILKAEIRFKTEAYNRNLENYQNEADHFFTYPNIYYFNNEPKSMSYVDKVTPFATINKTIYGPLPSDYDSLILNDFDKKEAGTPKDLVVDNPTKTSLDVRWTIDIKGIRDFFLGFTGITDKKVKYNLYVSQSYEKLDALQKLDNVADRIAASKPFTYTGANGSTMYFSQVDANAVNVVGTGVPTELLRSGDPSNATKNAVVITGIELVNDTSPEITVESLIAKYKIDGLDKNQKYYFAVDAVIEYEENLATKHIDSGLLGIKGEVTKADETDPNPNEKQPPAPDLRLDPVEKPTLDSVSLEWDKIKDADTTSTAVFEYEMIRVLNEQLDPAILNKKDDFKNVFDAIKITDKIGLKTDGSNPPLEFSNGTFTTAKDGRFENKIVDDIIKFKDKTVYPNQIYFYYARTVRTLGGKTLYSPWSVVSATTAAVDKPKNLVIERDYETYDPEKEIVFSFDAPIKELDRLGTDFDLVYSIKKNDGEWSKPIVMDVSKLKQAGMNSKSTQEVDHIHFIYKISGLETGTNYSLKVALIDKKTTAMSMYSNIAETRTKVNQADIDKMESITDWTKYLEGELKKLLKDYYWTASESESEFTAIYRPSMFGQLLNSSSDSAVGLAKTGVNKSIYYFPGSTIIDANKSNKGFKYGKDNIDLLISQNAFDIEKSQEFIDMAEKVRKGTISSFYVKVIIETVEYKELVKGEPALSPRINISFEVVGSTKSEKDFDALVERMVLDEIAKKMKDKYTNEQLVKMVEGKDIPEDMVKYVESLVIKAKSDIVTKINSEFNKTIKDTNVINGLSAPVIIRLKTDDAKLIVKGYELYQAAWRLIETINQVDFINIYTKSAGSYIFSGEKLSIPQLEGVPNGEELSQLIVKYGLTEFLGKGEAFNKDAPVTSGMIKGVTAKLMGATSTTNIDGFLKDKGYSTVTRNRVVNPPVSSQEAIYWIMSAYEVKTNTKIATVKISNFNLTKNIKNIDSKYSQSVKAAYELGIVDTSIMDASSPIKVEDLLKMLTKLKAKAKL